MTDGLAYLLLDEYALLFYFSESRIRSQNLLKSSSFRICRYLCLCFTVSFESIIKDCGNDSLVQNGNYS